MSARPATFLDSNAGAPLHPEVVEALLPFLQKGSQVSNPSSIHSHGRRAKRLAAEAKDRIALSLGRQIDPEQLIITSSGTEANQLAIRSVFEPLFARGEKPNWITTPVEHDSVLQMKDWIETRGGTVTFLPIDEAGLPRLDALAGLFRPNTALVSAVWVNNETGAILDAHGLSQKVRELGALLHLDAAQAWGKIPFDLNTLGAHYVSLSSHKIGGLAGTGALWIGRGAKVDAVIRGKQEKGRRGGTENLMGLVAMGAAAGAIDPARFAEKLGPLRDRLESAICSRIQNVRVNGCGADRVANTMNLSFAGVEGDGLVMALDLAGFSVSSGSACSSGFLEPSHVLLAMGRSKGEAMAAVRVSLTESTEWEELEEFVLALEQAVGRARNAKVLDGEKFAEAR